MCDTVLCYASDLRTCKSVAQSDDGMTCMGGDANVLRMVLNGVSVIYKKVQ